MRRWQVLISVLLCLSLAFSAACNPFGSDDSEDESLYQLVEVVRDDLVMSVSGSGNIAASTEAKLSFAMAGLVDEVYIEEGDEVDQGDELVQLDTGSLELALAQAEANLKTAEYNLDRAENPYTAQEMTNAQIAVFEAEYNLAFAKEMLAKAQAEGDDQAIMAWSAQVGQARSDLAIAEQRLDAMCCAADEEQVDLMELQVEVAEQAVEEAERQLELATMMAPFDGIIAGLYVEEGDTATPGITIIHLIDPDVMELIAEVDEIDIPQVKPGQKAVITVDALPEDEFDGIVSRISLISIELSGIVSYKVTVTFDIPEDDGVMVGMSATVDIITYQKNNVFLVPDRAVEQDSEGNYYVMVMDGEEIEITPVEIGVSDGYQTEITDGLKEGDMVVVATTARDSTSFDLFSQ